MHQDRTLPIWTLTLATESLGWCRERRQQKAR
jgi:hypothetical protein